MDQVPEVNGHSTSSPRHIFVFDNMRTRSHLFWRWVSTHPELYTTYHRFLNAAYLGPDSILPKLRDPEARAKENEEMLKMFGEQDTWESSNRDLERDIEEAEKQGKRLFSNEHIINLVLHYIQIDILRKNDNALPHFAFSFPNPTYMKDKLLAQLTPIILIRHPVLQVQSIYSTMSTYTQCKPGGDNFDLLTSLHGTRLVFEFFRLRRQETPIVVDAEDILWRTEELGASFCNAVGIAVTGLKDRWDPLPQEWWAKNPLVFAMTANRHILGLQEVLHKSTGIERPKEKPDPPNVEVAVQQWKEKYGEKVAEQLEERVRLAMPHYEYMVQHKI